MTNTPEYWARQLHPAIGTFHDTFTAAWHEVARMSYDNARNRKWLQTCLMKSYFADRAPKNLGPFTIDRRAIDSSPRLRLIHEPSGRPVPIRRAPGLRRSAAHSAKLRMRQGDLLEDSLAELVSKDAPIGTLAWDYAPVSTDGEISSPWPLTFLKCREGYALDDGVWDFSIPLRRGEEMAEMMTGFTPDEEGDFQLLGAEDEDDAAESE